MAIYTLVKPKEGLNPATASRLTIQASHRWRLAEDQQNRAGCWQKSAKAAEKTNSGKEINSKAAMRTSRHSGIAVLWESGPP
jgi:hypothetical protein